MTSRLALACAAFVVSFAAAQAQDASSTTEDQPTPTEETAAPAENAPEAETDGADPAEGAASDQPREVISAVHTDWQIRCNREETNCYMYQLAADARDVPVAEVSIVVVPQSTELAAGVTVVTPLMTFLPPGLQMKIDDGEVQRYQYEFCAAQGCVARFGLTEANLDQFRRGNKALLSVTSAENRSTPIVLDLSLSGFTAAFADLASR